jgi:hypothetical protein
MPGIPRRFSYGNGRPSRQAQRLLKIGQQTAGRHAMEVFAKTFNAWDATLTVDPDGHGKYSWKILVEDRRQGEPRLRCISSPLGFPSVSETILDGRAALEVLVPDPCPEGG